MFKSIVILMALVFAVAFAGIATAQPNGWGHHGYHSQPYHGYHSQPYRGGHSYHGHSGLRGLGIAVGIVGIAAAIDATSRPRVEYQYQPSVVYSDGYPVYGAEYRRVPVYCTSIDGRGYEYQYVCQYRTVRINP